MGEEYKIRLGVELDTDNISAQINSDKLKINPIKITLDPEHINKQIETIRKNIESLNKIKVNVGGGTGSGSAGTTGISKVINKDLSAVSFTLNNTKGDIDKFKSGLSKLNFSNSSIKSIVKDLQSVDVAVKKVDASFNKKTGNLDLKVTGVDKLDRVVTVIRQIDKEGNVTSINKISQSFEDASKKADKLRKKAQEIKLKIDTGTFDKDISNVETKLKKIGNVSKELSNNIKQMKYNKTRTANELDKGNIESAIKYYERYQKYLKTVNNQIGISGNKQKAINVDFSELKRLDSLVNNLKLKIAKLDPKVDSGQITELTGQLKQAESAYSSLLNKVKGKLTSGQFDYLSASAEKAENDLRELDAKAADTRAKLAREIKLKIDTGDFKKDISSVEDRYKKLSNVTQQLTNSKEELKRIQSSMYDSAKSGNIEDTIKYYERYKQVLKEVKNQLDINERAQKSANADQKLKDDKNLFRNQINAWMKENSAASKKFGDRLSRIKAQIDACDAAGLGHLKSQFKEIDAQAGAANLKMQTFGDRLKTQFKRYSSYFSVASVFIYTSMALKEMFNQVVAVDSAMTELRKVTDETNGTYEEFLGNAAKKAQQLGTTIDGYITSTADFARLGYEFADAAKLSEVANIYTVVGDEIDSVDDATKSIISTMKAFKIEADDSISIVDKFNEVSNNFAISSGGIGEALQRSASSLAAAGNTIDESIALVTASNTVVQDPEVVGTALKTVSMRIRGAKTELAEAGLETDNMAESTAKLRSEIMALSGVDIMKNDNEFKNTYQIMEELAAKWQDLTDIQQANGLPEHIEICV